MSCSIFKTENGLVFEVVLKWRYDEKKEKLAEIKKKYHKLNSAVKAEDAKLQKS